MKQGSQVLENILKLDVKMAMWNGLTENTTT
jgi:hypothetical protein